MRQVQIHGCDIMKCSICKKEIEKKYHNGKMYWDSGTPTISGSGNVSSLTDVASGDFTMNLTNALPDQVYATCVSGDEYGQSQAPNFNTGFTSRGYSTSAITVTATNFSGSSTDIKSVQVIVVR